MDASVGKAPGADVYAAETDPGGIAAGTRLPHASSEHVGFFHTLYLLSVKDHLLLLIILERGLRSNTESSFVQFFLLHLEILVLNYTFVLNCNGGNNHKNTHKQVLQTAPLH